MTAESPEKKTENETELQKLLKGNREGGSLKDRLIGGLKKSVKKETDTKKKKEKESWRETVESIVIAFIIAFLFRTFEAEAFVIPTGSMAPTLYGRNKQADCEQCGFHFTVGASDELGPSGELVERILSATCPNCRFENDIKMAPVSNGDRILVNKFPFEFNDPDRFDVIVFKYPNNPRTNYIKRLVGLPGETIRIHDGDLYKFDDQKGETILRKDDPYKQDAIQIVHYDDEFVPKQLIAQGWPERFASMEPSQSKSTYGHWQESDGWKINAAERSYRIEAKQSTEKSHWLRYRNLVPTLADWENVMAGRNFTPEPTLISDFCGYNTKYSEDGRDEDNRPREKFFDNAFWIGDLTIDATLNTFDVSNNAQVILELVEGICHFRCSLDLNTGVVKLVEINAQEDMTEERAMATAKTSYRGGQELKLAFANVDDRICLWINDNLIDFDGKNTYTRSSISGHSPTVEDLAPVGISVVGCGAEVSGLVLKRDIYYQGDDGSNHHGTGVFKSELRASLNDPIKYAQIYNNQKDARDFFQEVIPENEYFVLGDNSPRSSDGRLWSGTHTVPRKALVGKAFWIYWPPAVPFLGEDNNGFAMNYHFTYNSLGQKVKEPTYPYRRVPFLPNFWRMHRIR